MDHRIGGKPVRASGALGLLLASFALWLIPSRVVELVAEQREVLLNRYGIGWFSVLFLLTPLLWLASYACWASMRHAKKEVGFRIGAVVFSVLLSIVAIDIVGRLIRKPRYIEKTVQFRRHWPGERVSDVVRHRPPNTLYKIRYTDAPPTARSYPDAPPGYPTLEITLKTDARGYRNLTSLEEYDIVTVGDSFTEGSRVSDDQPWPVLLGKKLGRSVYNLGVSGGRPDYYFAAFRAFGEGLKPKMAIFMIYEGNDFKGIRLTEDGHSAGESWGERAIETVKASPVVVALKKAFIRYLGSVNANGPVSDADILSWMPVAISHGLGIQYYAFTPSELRRLDWAENDFQSSRNWMTTERFLERIKRLCDQEKIDLVFAYAPSKPHVIMPLVGEMIPAKKLHVFCSFRKGRLPPPDVFKAKLLDHLDSQENVLRRFCESRAIKFVSPTAAIRKMAGQGHQVYYTYDQHWTPLGHEIVADVLRDFLRGEGADSALFSGACRDQHLYASGTVSCRQGICVLARSTARKSMVTESRARRFPARHSTSP